LRDNQTDYQSYQNNCQNNPQPVLIVFHFLSTLHIDICQYLNLLLNPNPPGIINSYNKEN